MDFVFLVFLALVPGFGLLYFILYMDRNEQEPLGLVIFVILMGAVSAVPAGLIEMGLQSVTFPAMGVWGNAFMEAFLKVAWVEELCKLAVVFLVVWRKPAFNEESDGIVYVTSSALGFAILENILYVLNHGIGTGIMRAITAVPLHCFTGVVMGYFVGKAKVSGEKGTRYSNILLGFSLAVFFHGVYDALLFTKTEAAFLIFVLVLFLLGLAIVLLKRGRALSLARSRAVEAEAGPADDAPGEEGEPVYLLRTAPQAQVWKIIASRVIFFGVIVLWGVVALGVVINADVRKQISEVLSHSIVLSAFPLIFGLGLELSYHKQRQAEPEPAPVSEYLKRTSPVEEARSRPIPAHVYSMSTASTVPTVGAPPVFISPPGQMWRLALSRTLLILSAILWVIGIRLVIPGASPMAEAVETGGPDMILGMLGLTFFPIYYGVLLEISVRNRRRLFHFLGQYMPAGQITLSPPFQLWKIALSWLFFGFSGLLWMLFFWDLLSKPAGSKSFLDLALGLMVITAALVVPSVFMLKSYKENKEAFIEEQTRDLDGDPVSHGKAADYAAAPAQPDKELHDYADRLKKKRTPTGEW